MMAQEDSRGMNGYLKSQVQGFFSRLAAVRRRTTPISHETVQFEDNEDVNFSEDELAHSENRNREADIEEVVSQLGLMHPITYDGYNICELVKLSTLAKFNVTMLKAMCKHFELTYKARDVKDTLTKCLSKPCKNNGVCIPVYTNDTYTCKCQELIFGNHCVTDCSKPFGMEDGRILDSQITASSYYSNNESPSNGRLNRNLGGGAWSPITDATVGEYLQIDLGSNKTVYKVATQGRYNHYFRVTKYTLQYSDDGTLWTNYTINGAIQSFPGNFDSNTVVSHVLPVPFSARHVQFVVQEWNDHPDMRVEVYGCI
ncbi:hypothetical protein QZH41_020410 [Actinostola sp. cb2023]|nr:hypothetical protein QZH41_020410 [Actinostola sp. cb2023]